MITITGLTAKQKMILDVMWQIEDIQAVNTFINSLPPRDRIDAQGLLQVAIWESLELEGELEGWTDTAMEIIDRARH